MTTTRRNSRLRICHHYNYSSLRWRWTAIRSKFQCRKTILQIQTRKKSSQKMREYREWLIVAACKLVCTQKREKTEPQHKTQAPHHISTDQLFSSFFPSQHTAWRPRPVWPLKHHHNLPTSTTNPCHVIAFTNRNGKCIPEQTHTKNRNPDQNQQNPLHQNRTELSATDRSALSLLVSKMATGSHDSALHSSAAHCY